MLGQRNGKKCSDWSMCNFLTDQLKETDRQEGSLETTLPKSRKSMGNVVLGL